MLALNLRQTWQQRFVIISLLGVFGIHAQCQDTNSSNNNIRAPMPEYIQDFFLSDAVRCQEKGELQFTVATGSRHSLGADVEFQVEYGVTDRLQLGFELPYGFSPSRGHKNEDVPTWSSIEVAFLYQMIRTDRPFALSAGMTLEFPLGTGGKSAWVPTILMARSYRKFQFHASVLSEIEEMTPSIAYNIAAVYPVENNWFPTFEFNGRRTRFNSSYITPGLYKRIGHRAEIGIGIPVGAGRFADSHGFVLKTSWELGGDRGE